MSMVMYQDCLKLKSVLRMHDGVIKAFTGFMWRKSWAVIYVLCFRCVYIYSNKIYFVHDKMVDTR